MSGQNPVLDFVAVDGIAFAANRNRLDNMPANLAFKAHDLGPVVETAQLTLRDLLPVAPPWLDVGPFGLLYKAILERNATWVSSDGNTALLALQESAVSNLWTSFAMNAKRAAITAGFDSSFAGQMVAAIRELEDNIREHAGTLTGASLCFHATSSRFEFTVADHGCGFLATLRRNPDLAFLSDDGAALRAGLQDGVSRFGLRENRGHGYRPLFTGLANRRAMLRFRSGLASLEIDGVTPGLPAAKIAQKPNLVGCFASVCCTL